MAVAYRVLNARELLRGVHFTPKVPDSHARDGEDGGPVPEGRRPPAEAS
jgi:hypothetical protein